MKIKATLCLYMIFAICKFVHSQSKSTISGYVRDKETGEGLIGAALMLKEISKGTVTNPSGFYSLTVPSGSYNIIVSYIGYEQYTQTLELKGGEIEFNILMKPNILGLEEVVVHSGAIDENISDMPMGEVRFNMGQLKKMPALFGEPDIIKAVQMQPGVISAGEGTSGFFVRGGNASQNLILRDEAPIYSPSHMFGMFSVFNTDVIKGSELYKGGIPPRFGGRLSSILDIHTKGGNNQNLVIQGGLGTLASRLSVEGPLAKNKSSFLVSGRRSYLDVFQGMLGNEEVKRNFAKFYDLNARVDHKFNNNNYVFLSGYFGRDNLSFERGDKQFNWGNATFTARWGHLFSKRLCSNATLVFADFGYNYINNSPGENFDWHSDLKELQVKFDFNYYLSPSNNLSFGYQSAYKIFSPAEISPNAPHSILKKSNLGSLYALEHDFYISNEQTIGPMWAMEYGFRLSMFQNIGESTIRKYNEGGTSANLSYSDVKYNKWENIKTFVAPEPRASVLYRLSPGSSLKASYDHMVQNIHLMSNSTVPIPFNTWRPSSLYLDPQASDQMALGFYKNFGHKTYGFSSEVYYKAMKNVPEFVDNANIMFNPDLSLEIRSGKAYSYGIEFSLLRKIGKLQGAASYTWSKTWYDIPGVNGDKKFLANYNRKHNANIMVTYDINDKWSVGGTWTYGSGRPVTLPVGKYQFRNKTVDYITDRNGYRLPAFHRLDLSATLTPTNNKNRKWQGSWVFSIYNAYNRKNPFTIYSNYPYLPRDKGGQSMKKEFQMMYLFPILPFVTYNFKF